MKKWGKSVLIAGLVIGTLLVSGCGEEEKYNSAKNELLKLGQESGAVMDEANKAHVGHHVVHAADNMTQEQIEKAIQAIDVAQPKMEAIKKQADEKFNTMKEAAKSKVELNNDLLKMEEVKKQQIDLDTEYLKRQKEEFKKQLQDIQDGKRNKDGSPEFQDGFWDIVNKQKK